MADSYVQGRKLYVGGRDLSGDWTAITLRGGRAAIPWTRGADVGESSRPGPRMVSLEAEGIADLGTDLEDQELNGFVDLTDVPIIVAPTDGTEGEPAYAFLAEMGDLEPISGGTVGDRLNFRVSARSSSSKLVRGTIIEDGVTAQTASTDGTAFELGPVSATQKIYACLMVLSASAGDTLDVVIAGDSQEDFLATPATHVTFDQKTTAGEYQWVEVSGAITDTWFRVESTIGGASPSFEYVVLFAIA